MNLTLQELKELLKNQVDEISLLEVLNITAEDIVEKFEDRIEENHDRLAREFESESQEESETD